MAKISDIQEQGKGKSYYRIKDIIGQPVIIDEDVNASSDFREWKKPDSDFAPMLCMFVINKMTNERKDLNLSNAQLRAIRDALPRNVSWKGLSFVVNGISGQGFTAKAQITYLMGDYAAPRDQTRIGDIKTPDAFPQAPETMEQKTQRFLTGLGNSIGVHDSRIIDTLTGVFGSPDQATFILGLLKQTGRITQKPDGCWIRT